jgi:hypothetical protein
MSIVTNLSQAVQQVTDKRKRDSIDKALCVLFQSLNQRSLSPDLVAKLVRFAENPSSPASKEIIKALGTDHWDAFKPFMNIKFL